MINRSKKIVILIVLLAFAVTACETTPGPKATVGGLGGAAAGGLIGAAAGGGAAGIAAGVLLGGLLGGAIGDRLDAADHRAADAAAQQAFERAPSGTKTTWRNPDSGNHGTITPTRTYQTAQGTYLSGVPADDHD